MHAFSDFYHKYGHYIEYGVLTVGAVFGFLALMYGRYRTKKEWDGDAVTLAMVFGAGITSGLHLAFSAFITDMLVFLADNNGFRYDKNELAVELDGFCIACGSLHYSLGATHFFHILVAGFVIFAICSRGLYRICI